MKYHHLIAILGGFTAPLQAQAVLEWALSETSPTPDVDDTGALNGTLQVPIIGDGVTSSITNSSALMGRITPVTLANVNDSISISYQFLAMGGISGSATNANLRWGLFNSNGTTFGGDEANLSGWTGTFAVNSGAATNDADIYVRSIGNTERFYASGGAIDVTSGTDDVANQNFNANGVIYTFTMTVTRLTGAIMDISTTLTGDDGYSFSITAQETTNAEFTFDRVGFWVNSLSAELVALKASSAPASTDGDAIPDLEEARWFYNLTTANDSTDFDNDGISDLDEITVNLTNPTVPQSADLFVDFNADGTSGQFGPNVEAAYQAFTKPHESNNIENPAGVDYQITAGNVNVKVTYSDDMGFTGYGPTIKQMVGRDATSPYDGQLPLLMRDWVGIDSRASAGGNGPVGNPSGSPTNMKFTISGLPAGDYQYRAYHHDALDIRGHFELAITDANRTGGSLGNFQMTSSIGTAAGNPAYDVDGTRGTQGVSAATLTFDASAPLPSGSETRVLHSANIGQATVSGGTLAVYIDDFPATTNGTANDRTWYSGIGYRSTTSGDVFYVDATLANTDIAAGGADTLWADGNDGTTAGTIADGTATSDGKWRFRGGFGNGGIWEATGSTAAVENCVEIKTSATVPNDTYDVFVFYYPVNATGAYPIRAGLAPGPAAIPGDNPGSGNPPSVLASTITVPFESDGVNPVEFIYKVYETPGSERLSVVGVNGFEISEVVAGYSGWAEENAGGQDPDEDFDLDGIENGVEFFMGSVVGFTANPALDSGNTITWPKSASFVGTFKVQTSPDLVNWTDETATDNGSSISFTLTGAGKRFVRLMVTPN